MSEDLVRAEVRPGGVGVITLWRPDRLNAISISLADELQAAVNRLAGDPGVGALVVAGGGKAFCAGADISEFATFDGPEDFRGFLDRISVPLASLVTCPKPSVAALHGAALGGGLELALACDLRVAEEGTRLGVPEIKLGLLPGAGGTARLPQELPLGVVRRMLMTGEPIDADEALGYGLVAKVVPQGRALDEAVALALSVAGASPPALAAAKRVLALRPTLTSDQALELERRTVSELFGTAQAAQGITAFLERRRR